VATVSSSGLVTAVATGSVDITATTVEGSKTSSSTVTVTPAPTVTYYTPVAASILVGSLKSGSYSNLASNDASYFVVNSKTPKPYIADWYGKFTITEDPDHVVRFTVNYDGKYSRTATQVLYLYNFSTSGWVQINSRSVGTSDVTTTYLQSTPSNYISSSGEIRVRVYASVSSKSYTCSGDWLQIKLESIIPPIAFNSVDLSNEPAKYTFEAFPNPTSGKITFRLNLASDTQADIEIYDTQGTQVAMVADNATFRSGLNEIEFNTSRLNSGIYLCKFKMKNSSEEKILKISIQK
jgi:hypothetical protein